MVRRAVIIAFLGCIAYSLLLAIVPRSLIRRGVSDQQLSYIRAEQILFASDLPENVLVGSSIAGLLRQEQLGESMGLRAFGGGCSAPVCVCWKARARFPNDCLLKPM